MRKLLATSLGYLLAGLAGGVFYREFTKFWGFEGRTTLSFVHLHVLVLGMVMFLILVLFEHRFQLVQEKLFSVFFGIYNAGLVVTVGSMVARGVTQVLGAELSGGADAAISGVSGLGHILLAAGLILLFVILLRKTKKPNVPQVS